MFLVQSSLIALFVVLMVASSEEVHIFFDSFEFKMFDTSSRCDSDDSAQGPRVFKIT